MYPIYHFDLEQKSEDWYNLRKGKLTGSKAYPISNQGAGLETVCKEIVREFYSEKKEERYTNEHMERGNELEALAREVYQLETGNTVTEIGLVEYSETIAVSPDGLVNDNGLIEIKCHDDKLHFDLIMNFEDIPKPYYMQMQMQMLVTGRKWCDYVSYNPNFKKNIFIKRVEPDLQAFEKIKQGLEKGKTRITELKKQYENLCK